MANQTKLNQTMNTQPTPEDKQIMNDILIQLEQNERKSKRIYTSQLMSFLQKQMKL
jgi:hypothetical protein